MLNFNILCDSIERIILSDLTTFSKHSIPHLQYFHYNSLFVVVVFIQVDNSKRKKKKEKT